MGLLFKEVTNDGVTLPVPLNCPNCKVNNTWMKSPVKQIILSTEKPPQAFKCIKCGCEATINKELMPVIFDGEVIRDV